MSSMHRKTTTALLALLAFAPVCAFAQDNSDNVLMGEDGRQWDQARSALQTLPPGVAGLVAKPAIAQRQRRAQPAAYGPGYLWLILPRRPRWPARVPVQ